jgi:simple sugar transport system substrate-binding protein
LLSKGGSEMESDGSGRMTPSRRDFVKGMSALSVAGLLAACSSNGDDDPGGTQTQAAGVGDFPETPEYNFVFVNHVTTNPFFTPTQYGIADASAILGTTSQWTGSETSEISEMVDAMETAIAGQADGIAVCLVDLEAFNDPTDRALAAGIPVISYNADAANNRLAYVGQDLYGSGYEMGKKIVETVGEGSVGLFIATPGQLNIQPRIDGAVQAIKDSGNNITTESIATGADLNDEFNAIEAWYLGHTDAAGMYAVDAGSTQGIGQVVEQHSARDAGLKGAGGYDLLEETVRLVADGVLDFTIDQQPYLQGFLPTLYLYLYKLSGSVAKPPVTNTGLIFLDSEAATLFQGTASRFEGDSADQKLVEPVA